MTRKLLTLIAFGGFVALAACSSDDDASESSSSFCSKKAAAECETLALPCGTDKDTCTSKRTTVCNGAAAAAAGQGRAFQANAASACISKVEDTYTSPAVTGEAEAALAKVCERVFGGAKPERTACANSFECATGLICDTLCAKENAVALNGPCANVGDVCEKGTYCQASGGKAKFCNKKNGVNDICTPDTPCLETLRCTLGKCLEKVKVGQACNNDDDCVNEAPYCDPKSKTCLQKYQSGNVVCGDFR